MEKAALPWIIPEMKGLIPLLYFVALLKACLVTSMEMWAGFGPVYMPNLRSNFGNMCTCVHVMPETRNQGPSIQPLELESVVHDRLWFLTQVSLKSPKNNMVHRIF